MRDADFDGGVFLAGIFLGILLTAFLWPSIKSGDKAKLVEFRAQAVELNYAEYKVIDIGTGKTEFTWKKEDKNLTK